jgi:8-oxo-dGTP pyrophosphatase MutT (NUDIX family)
VYCVNCGEKGHVVKDCDGPITSFGIIAFKITTNTLEDRFDKNNALRDIVNSLPRECSVLPKIKFLMIQRKDTMGYIDFVRGKYPENNKDAKLKLLHIWLNEMTAKEKTTLLTKSFDEIWDMLWVNHESKCYRNEYHLAKLKFERLDIKSLVAQSHTQFTFQEFSFPKGRRNMRESNIACAEREFYEETGYCKQHYDFIKNYPTIHEEFTGTNGVKYRHIYYLVKMHENIPPPRIDYSNIVQTGEVQNIGWFSYEECMALIRPYDSAKKSAIKNVYNDIVEMDNQYNCSSFYYNSRKRNYIPAKTDFRYNYFKSRSF